MIFPITEKQYELRELAFRKLADNIEKAKKGEFVNVKGHLTSYEELLDKLWTGDTTQEEIDYLQSLPPSDDYKKSLYEGSLLGGADVPNVEMEELHTLEEQGIYFIDNDGEDPTKRIRWNKETQDFKYI